MRAGLPVYSCAAHRQFIDHTSSTILSGIAIEYFTVNSREWHSHAVVVAHDGSEVTYKDERILLFCPATLKRDHAVVRIVGIDPREAARIEIQFAQRWRSHVEMIQIAQVCQQ